MKLKSLDERLSQDVQGWKPEAGEQITGTVASVETRPSEFGEDYPYIEVETADGTTWGLHAFHTVFRNEIARTRPAVGDTIGVRYKGKIEARRTDAKGRPVQFESYRVIVEKTNPLPAPDWDSMRVEDTDQPATEQTEEDDRF